MAIFFQKNLLITRPAHQANNLHKQLESLGARCFLFPTVAIEILPFQPFLLTALEGLPQGAKVIFVSANAVQAVMPYWPKNSKLSVFAIGPGTAAALTQWHREAILPQQENYCSEGLLALPELTHVSNHPILIFAGLTGRELLLDTLKQRGARVEKIPVYKRVLPQTLSEAVFNSWRQHGFTAIISTSEESLRNLYVLVGKKAHPWLLNQQLVVINSAMCRLATQLGFSKPPLLAKNASDAAILQVLSN